MRESRPTASTPAPSSSPRASSTSPQGPPGPLRQVLPAGDPPPALEAGGQGPGYEELLIAMPANGYSRAQTERALKIKSFFIQVVNLQCRTAGGGVGCLRLR
jgi:hypothetical protein